MFLINDMRHNMYHAYVIHNSKSSKTQKMQSFILKKKRDSSFILIFYY